MSESFEQKKSSIESGIVEQIKAAGFPLEKSKDLNPLIDEIGDAKYVLLGEATHGTHEYYVWRTKITQRLILEKEFSFIAVEGDWPDCYRLNRYVKGYEMKEKNAVEVLKTFNRWPTWMWANWEIVALAEWMRDYNKNKPLEEKVGFYGLDVYSLRESLESILNYLKHTDQLAYETAKKTMECFEPFGYEGVSYARMTRLLPGSCENEVIKLLQEIQNRISLFNTDHETVFSTEQNAYVALNAENYYREMIKGGHAAWNVRDRHMVETLERLMTFHGKNAKAIVWEHNTHIGDARATDMTKDGMINLGELVTSNHEEGEVVKIGFGSYVGKVIAGKNWGDNMRKMDIPEAIAGSWEALLHRTSSKNILLLLNNWKNNPLFKQPIDHRAIGVVYNPGRDSDLNYVPSVIPKRYDAFLYFDETTAVHPLYITPDGDQMPETYPWGE